MIQNRSLNLMGYIVLRRSHHHFLCNRGSKEIFWFILLAK